MKRNNQRGRNGGGSIHPQPFQPSFVLKKKIRFKAVAAATPTITYNDLLDLWCVAATATSAYRLATAVRIRKIELWGPMASDLVPVTVSVDWSGSTTAGAYGKSNKVSDTSMGSSEPAHLVTRPPPQSQSSQWIQTTSAINMCSLAFPAGTVIDLSYDLVVRDDGTAQAVQSAVAGATVGVNYIRALDSTSATNIVPVSYSTI